VKSCNVNTNSNNETYCSELELQGYDTKNLINEYETSQLRQKNNWPTFKCRDESAKRVLFSVFL